MDVATCPSSSHGIAYLAPTAGVLAAARGDGQHLAKGSHANAAIAQASMPRHAADNPGHIFEFLLSTRFLDASICCWIISARGLASMLAALGITRRSPLPGPRFLAQMILIAAVRMNPVMACDVVINPAQEYQTIEGWGTPFGTPAGGVPQAVFQMGSAIADPVIHQLVDRLVFDLGINGSRFAEVGSRTDGEPNDDGDCDAVDWGKFHLSIQQKEELNYVPYFLSDIIANGDRPTFYLDHVGYSALANEARPWCLLDPGERAQQIWSNALYLSSNYGVNANYAVICNEPGNNALWNNQMLLDDMKAAGPRLANLGLGTQMQYAEDISPNGSWTHINGAQNDPTVWPFIGRLSTHLYGATEPYLTCIRDYGTLKQIQAAETESDPIDINALYEDLTAGGVAHWEIAYSLKNTLAANAGMTCYSPTGYYFPIRQLLHYVRPGAVRIGALSDSPQLRVLAFSRNSASDVVLWNNTGGPAQIVNLSGLTPGAYGLSQVALNANTETTSPSASFVELGVQSVGAGGVLTLNVAANTISTLYQRPAANQPPTIETWTANPGCVLAPASVTQLSVVASDPDLDPLTFTWSVASQPAGAAAVIATPASATTNVNGMTISGLYAFSIKVSDGAHIVTQTVYVQRLSNDPAPTLGAVGFFLAAPYGDELDYPGGTPLTATISLPATLPAPAEWLIANYTDILNGSTTGDWGIVSQPPGSAISLSATTNVYGSYRSSINNITLPGQYIFQVAVSNASGTATVRVILDVLPEILPPAVNSLTASQLTLTLPSSATQLSATASDLQGDLMRYWWYVSSAPAGANPVFDHQELAVANVSGLAIPGQYVFTIRAFNNISMTTANMTVTVDPAPGAPVVSSPAAVTLVTGNPLTYHITASGSPASYGASSLPPGLSINASTGAITGIPPVIGLYNINLSATNGNGTGNANLALTVNPPAPVITSPSNGDGLANQAFSFTLRATPIVTQFGATGLPAGLSLNALTGAITGTPTIPGAYPIAISATNVTTTTNGNMTIIVYGSANPAIPGITSPSSATATTGTAFSYQITASHNPTGFFAIGLPLGLSFDPSSGVISGATAVSGTFSVTLEASNAGGIGSGPLSLTISAGGGPATLMPLISWRAPAPIGYGTPLSANQLRATANVAGTFSYVPSLGAILPLGTNVLNVTFTPADSVDYATATASVSVVVNKASPIITWNAPASISYGTPLSGTQLDATASVPGTFAYAPASGTVLAAGAGPPPGLGQFLTVVFTPTDAAHYDAAIGAMTIMVTQAPLTVSANNCSRPVNVANPALTVSYSGFVHGDTALNLAGALSILTTAVLSSPAGTYPITASGQTSANYAITYVAGTLTVTGGARTTPTITWTAPAGIVYGTGLSATQLDAAASVPGTFTYTPAAGTVLAAGANHALSVAFTPTDTTDYSNASGATAITVTPAPLSVVASAASRAFGAANPAFTGTLTGVIAGDGITATYASSATAATPAGVYAAATAQAITPTLVDPNHTLGDYAVTSTDGTLTITKAASAVTWTAPASIVYGTALSATQLDATASVPGTFIYTPTAGTVLAAGANQALSVAFTPTDTTDYGNASGATAITVTPAPLRVSANNASRPVNTANPSFTVAYAGFVHGDGAQSLGGTLSITTTAVLGSPAGTYAITASGQTSANYAITDVAGILTVTAVGQTTPTIAWTPPAGMVYGTALTATQLDATASVPGTFTYTPAIGAVLAAGANQSLSVQFVPTDATDYTNASGTTAITVTPAPLSVAANPAARAFDAANPSFTGTLTGMIAGDGITATYASSATAATPAGVYGPATSQAITPTLVDPNHKLGDYAVTLRNGTLTITKAAPLVAWTAPAGIVYGTALTATQLDATASVPGTFTYTPAAGTVLAVGANQALSVQFVPTDTTDYTNASGTTAITVTPAPLSVVASAASRAVGAANPAFTGTLTGAIAGDGITATYASSATAATPAGVYGPASPETITPSLSDPNGRLANYAVTMTDGTLTITAAAGGGSSGSGTGGIVGSGSGGGGSDGGPECGLGGGMGLLLLSCVALCARRRRRDPACASRTSRGGG